jgi:hypothetical protein
LPRSGSWNRTRRRILPLLGKELVEADNNDQQIISDWVRLAKNPKVSKFQSISGRRTEYYDSVHEYRLNIRSICRLKSK